MLLGTYGLAVYCSSYVLVGYNKFSFYQAIVTPESFGLRGARDGRLVDAQAPVAANCDNKEYFEGHYEQL